MSFIETYTKGRFHPTAPVVEEVQLLDIAHALSQICRYTGHCPNFYSVAQHSVLVMEVTKTLAPGNRDNYGLMMGALMHDAHEAYVSDVSAPLKKHLPDYRRIADGVQDVIEHRFGVCISDVERKMIEYADLSVLMAEARDFGFDYRSWGIPVEPWAGRVYPLEPAKAKDLFVEAYSSLVPHRQMSMGLPSMVS